MAEDWRTAYGRVKMELEEYKETIVPALMERVQELEQQWIPVTKRLPEEMGCYFITVRHWLDGKPVTREAYWNGADWLSCERRHELTPRVTHWMPLPEPPKETELRGDTD